MNITDLQDGTIFHSDHRWFIKGDTHCMCIASGIMLSNEYLSINFTVDTSYPVFHIMSLYNVLEDNHMIFEDLTSLNFATEA